MGHRHATATAHPASTLCTSPCATGQQSQVTEKPRQCGLGSKMPLLNQIPMRYHTNSLEEPQVGKCSYCSDPIILSCRAQDRLICPSSVLVLCLRNWCLDINQMKSLLSLHVRHVAALAPVCVGLEHSKKLLSRYFHTSWSLPLSPEQKKYR